MRNIISMSPTRVGFSIAVIDVNSKVEILSAPVDDSIGDKPLNIAEHIIKHHKLNLSDFNFDLFHYACRCGDDVQAEYSCDGFFHFKCIHCGHYEYKSSVPEDTEMF